MHRIGELVTGGHTHFVDGGIGKFHDHAVIWTIQIQDVGNRWKYARHVAKDNDKLLRLVYRDPLNRQWLGCSHGWQQHGGG